MASELSIMVTTLVAAMIASFSQYVLKRHTERFSIGVQGMRYLLMNRGVWLGILMYLASLAVYLLALRSGQLSFVYPTFASTFIFVTLVSHFMLKERIGRRRSMGIALVVIGIATVALTY